MQVDTDELPITIGTVQCHDDSHVYTFRVLQCTELGWLQATSRLC